MAKKTHLLGFPGRVGALEYHYDLFAARKDGRCVTHDTAAGLYEHYVAGDELIVTGPQPRWKAGLAQYGMSHLITGHVQDSPLAFHQKLMEIASTTDKTETLRRCIRDNIYLRHHFAYGLIVIAEEARRMGLERVSVIEFGVWSGIGLRNLAALAKVVEDCTGVAFDVYGFDTGAGMPAPDDWRDHPEIWQEGEMVMPDFEAVAASLPDNCELIIGPIAETIDEFCETKMSADAPLGFISFDMDYYSSTVQSLRVMENPADHYLPALTVWVDDSYINIMQTHKAGEALALLDFNETHELRKFDFKPIRANQPSMLWHYGIWFCHIFDHPMRSGAVKSADFNNFFVTDW